MLRPRDAIFLAIVMGWSSVAIAEGSAIYSCVDAKGRRITSDRPVPECLTREQRLHNSDGSVQKLVPPALTADEQAEVDEQERIRAAERAMRQDALRRDRNLLARFPNEVAHQKARIAALADVEKGVQLSEKRLVELKSERTPLLAEAEFYGGRPLPWELKRKLNGNDAAAAAQRSLVLNQKDEILRIDTKYSLELEHLKKLWSGTPLGSVDPPQAAVGHVYRPSENY